ncbi:peptidylprolyl isomerase, partial [Staphylococcus epidermidis]|uniref:peptidylprolyl isomerase n=1 Tax=Staphylococcus epidermidis TaxID=1282 RepID=UPI001C92DC82
ISDFILQGRHPTPTPIPPQTIYPTPFQHQFSLQPFNLYPPLSIPNAPPNTNPSQFFILQIKQLPQNILTQLAHPPSPQPILQPYRQKPPTPSLHQKHTLFPQLIHPQSTLEDIPNTKLAAQHKPVYHL